MVEGLAQPLLKITKEGPCSAASEMYQDSPFPAATDEWKGGSRRTVFDLPISGRPPLVLQAEQGIQVYALCCLFLLLPFALPARPANVRVRFKTKLNTPDTIKIYQAYHQPQLSLLISDKKARQKQQGQRAPLDGEHTAPVNMCQGHISERAYPGGGRSSKSAELGAGLLPRLVTSDSGGASGSEGSSARV